VSGEVQRHFEDVLVYASQSLPTKHVYHLSPWELRRIEEFRAEFLSGFQTERYTLGLREGFDQARAIMDQEIRRLCEQDIGGNHQRLLSVQTQHVGVAFKHILLPVWLAAYRYREEPYRVLINGRTGKVVGTRPYSWVKITVLVLAIVLAVIAAILLFASQARSAPARQASLRALGSASDLLAGVMPARRAPVSPRGGRALPLLGRESLGDLSESSTTARASLLPMRWSTQLTRRARQGNPGRAAPVLDAGQWSRFDQHFATAWQMVRRRMVNPAVPLRLRATILPPPGRVGPHRAVL
jgi:hypothetical protein